MNHVVVVSAASAIATTTSPRFGAVFIATFAAVVGILHAREIEVLFPIGTLFLERSGTVADLDPSRGAVRKKARVLYVPKIFAFCDRTSAQSSTFDGFEKGSLKAGLDAGTHQIAHGYEAPM